MTEPDPYAPQDDEMMEVAAGWLLRERSGMDARARETLAALLAEDVAFRRAYGRVARGWDALDQVGSSPVMLAARAAALEQPPRIRPVPRFAYALAAAAVLVAMIVVGAVRFPVIRPAERAITAQAPAEIYRTPRGGRTTVTLADGSVMSLNTDTVARVRFTATRRSVELLRGEAYFQVSHDAGRPFVVDAGHRDIVAVGTAFDVYRDPAIIRVVLAEGRITVGPPRRRAGSAQAAADLHVRPGQGVVYDVARGQARLRPMNLAALTSWREGRLRFDAVALDAAVAELNRYSDVQLELTDSSLRDLRISGVFRTGQPDAFVAALTKLFPIQARREGLVIQLERRSN